MHRAIFFLLFFFVAAFAAPPPPEQNQPERGQPSNSRPQNSQKPSSNQDSEEREHKPGDILGVRATQYETKVTKVGHSLSLVPIISIILISIVEFISESCYSSWRRPWSEPGNKII